MTPEELATKHFPYNTTCPMKRKKIDWQREQLAKDIKDFAAAHSATGLIGGKDIVYHYTPKQELK